MRDRCRCARLAYELYGRLSPSTPLAELSDSRARLIPPLTAAVPISARDLCHRRSDRAVARFTLDGDTESA